MNTLQVYDPPMCCSTGICGPSVDPALIRFAADLDWLKSQGVHVQRYNLSQEPMAFVENEAVKSALGAEGNDCLPMILVEGKTVFKGAYPESREQLAFLLGLEATAQEEGCCAGSTEEASCCSTTTDGSIYTPAVAELVAIGAAIASNCDPCFKYHYDQARKLGVSKEDMRRAVETAQAVKETPARHMTDLTERYLSTKEHVATPTQSCCGTETPQLAAELPVSKCC